MKNALDVIDDLKAYTNNQELIVSFPFEGEVFYIDSIGDTMMNLIGGRQLPIVALAVVPANQLGVWEQCEPPFEWFEDEDDA